MTERSLKAAADLRSKRNTKIFGTLTKNKERERSFKFKIPEFYFERISWFREGIKSDKSSFISAVVISLPRCFEANVSRILSGTILSLRCLTSSSRETCQLSSSSQENFKTKLPVLL